MTRWRVGQAIELTWSFKSMIILIVGVIWDDDQQVKLFRCLTLYSETLKPGRVELWHPNNMRLGKEIA